MSLVSRGLGESSGGSSSGSGVARIRPDFSTGLDLSDFETNILMLDDGIDAPGTVVGRAQLYVDTADGDLKIKYGDGIVKTIVVDT